MATPGLLLATFMAGSLYHESRLGEYFSQLKATGVHSCKTVNKNEEWTNAKTPHKKDAMSVIALLHESNPPIATVKSFRKWFRFLLSGVSKLV